MLKSLIHHVVTFDENLQNCQTLVIPNKVIRGTKFCLTRYYENLGCQNPKKKKKKFGTRPKFTKQSVSSFFEYFLGGFGGQLFFIMLHACVTVYSLVLPSMSFFPKCYIHIYATCL